MRQYVELSMKHIGEPVEIDCEIELFENGITFHAYTVSVAHRDLFFYCNEGTLNYVVDVYSGIGSAVLHNMELDEEIV